jgi:hypothetical protein
LSEVTDVHARLLQAHPALCHARRCELRNCKANPAGKMLIDLVRQFECV